MQSQAEIYDEAVANFETGAAMIRQKAAKLRTNKQNGPSDRAVNSPQPRTS
jgi:hypothetical protein